MPSSSEIRQQFIDFFAQRCGHTPVPSSPVVPHEDPTLLFTNAGMNQFKDVFLGVGTRPYSRAVDTQKCIRAGGKHNDLDDVGKDTYHHTFFEMLGNWSFGDYFKKEAIQWAWQLLTEVWGLDKSRLHATVFGGDEQDGLKPDEEAAEYWRTLTDIHPSHIHYGSKKDNFWEMGDTGPCGPSSEIHVDLTPDKSGRDLVNVGDARVIEIWNLVFIQFNRETSGQLVPLPARHVDTGMGFERICAVLQGKTSNYDTDLFTPLFRNIREISGAEPYTGDLKKPEDIAYRAIADHVRTLTFALTDGAIPSNEGRGYVLRRILRRAVRYGRQTLGMTEPFIYRLVPTVIDLMGGVFPELRKDPQSVINLIHEEEISFGHTLDRGIELFNEAASRGGRQISGEDAFRLYDTFGFPLDLTVLMAEERGMSVDVAGFNRLMAEARERSRSEGGHHDLRQELVSIVQKSELPPTRFVGYDELIADQATIESVYLTQNGSFAPADTLQAGQAAAVVVDHSPFYAEAGGQVGDTGYIRSRHGAVFRVRDTLKVGDIHFHLGELESGNIRRDAPAMTEEENLMLEVDEPRRRQIMIHHTTTHLLNWALREVLGDHVQQKGSLVDEYRTRFDFSHNLPLAPEQIERIEALVNERIGQDLPVYTQVAPQEEAIRIHGLRAVFGEKYPPMVRVCSIGVPVNDLLAEPEKEDWWAYSVEFCGGTHLPSTGVAQQFVIVSEEAVAKGIRRVTALAGPAAAQAQRDARTLLDRLESLGHEKPEALAEGVSEFSDTLGRKILPVGVRTRLREGLENLQKQLKEHQKQQAKETAAGAVDAARQIADQADGPVIVASLPDADQQALRSAMDVIRKKRPDAALLLGSASKGKVAFVAAVPEELIKQGLKAGDWVREAAKVTGGGGGGRPDMAQAGGKDPDKLDAALEAARDFASNKVG